MTPSTALPPWSPRQRVAKRGLDLVVGSLLLVLSLPLILGAALISAWCYRAWPLFVQDRVGHGGRTIRVPKIRTLAPDFPRYALKTDGAGLPGMPACMAWLRRLHLDELPQLAMVVAGQMSLVGPRPKMPDEHEPVDPVYAAVRTQVKQGCTCLWQVGPDTHLLPSEAPDYDVHYVVAGTVRLDLWILWRTLLTVLGIHRPVTLADIPQWARRATDLETTPHARALVESAA